MGRIFSGGFATEPAPVNYDGGTASGVRTSIHLNGGSVELAPLPPMPSVPDILSRIVYRNDCEYIANADDPALIDAITFDDNTLSKAVSIAMLANAEGSQPLLYTTQNHTDGIYVRRHDHLLPGIDLSCISPWNSAGGTTRAGAAITPLHVIISTHYPIAAGSQIRFVSMQNEPVTRTVAVSTQILGDATVLTLSEPLPENIKPALVMPPDWEDYLGESGTTITGMFWIDRQERLIPGRFAGTTGVQTTQGITIRSLAIQQSSYTSLAARFVSATGGDSGSPMFMVIGKNVIMLAPVFGPTTGHALFSMMPQLEAITGSTPVNRISLSGFTKYA